MLKKGLIYFVLFLCLSGLNFFLVIKTYGVFDKQTQIEKILSAIAEEKNKPNEGYRAEATVVDGRVANLKSFFRKYNSPLYNNAEKSKYLTYINLITGCYLQSPCRNLISAASYQMIPITAGDGGFMERR